MTGTARRVAVVTGAARGIGAATVRRLVGAGCHVVAVDWCVGDDSPLAYPQAQRADLDALVRALPPGSIVPVVGDVRDLVDMRRAVEHGLDAWGRVDVAVAAAGVIAGGRPGWEDESLPLLWSVNVAGVANLARASVPVMLAGSEPSGGRFVAVASAAGARGLFHLAAYSAAKHGVVGLVRGLAADLVGTGVTACAVSPGSTDTDMLRETARLYDVDAEVLGLQQLLRRTLSPDEVAAAISFACSTEGAVLNGSVVNADGGFGA